jgi:hypothetical protein
MHKILVYLHIIHLLKSSTCFEHYPDHLQEVHVVIVYMRSLVSSLSAGDCLVHRLRKKLCIKLVIRKLYNDARSTLSSTINQSSITIFLSDFHKARIFSTNFEEILRFKFHENPSRESRFVSCGRTDGRTDIQTKGS